MSISADELLKMKDASDQKKCYLRASKYRSTDTYAPRDWVVSDLLAIGWMNIWIGPEKSRKSCFALFMAMCIACGKNWYKFHIPEPKTAVYFSAEDPSDELDLRYRVFLALFSSAEQELIERNFSLIKGREYFVNKGIKITHDQTEFWKEFVAEYPAQVYFLDALEMFTTNESNGELRDALIQLRNYFGGKACLNILHHTRKREDREISRENDPVLLRNLGVRLWSDKCLGGGAIKRLADTIICQEHIYIKAAGTGEVIDESTDFAAFGKCMDDTGHLEFKPGETKYIAEFVTTPSGPEEAALRVLQLSGTRTWISLNAAAIATKMPRSTGNIRIRGLIQKGHLRKFEDGHIELVH